MGVQIIRESVSVWVGLVGWRLGGQRLVKRRVLVQVGPYFGMLPHEAGAAIETGIGRERLGNRGMLGQESLVALKRVGLRTGRPTERRYHCHRIVMLVIFDIPSSSPGPRPRTVARRSAALDL